MEKHKTITAIINKIQTSFEPGAIQIVDFWEGDLCAIGIKKNDKLIYISTYNYINNTSTNYDFDLEIIPGDNSYKVVKEVSNASEQELLKTISTFFELPHTLRNPSQESNIEKVLLKYIRILNILLGSLPFLFAICLYIFFYWSRSFIATHEKGTTSEGLTILSRILNPLLSITFYAIIPNLMLMIILWGLSRNRKERTMPYFIFYLSGIALMIGIIRLDPSGAFSWYLD